MIINFYFFSLDFYYPWKYFNFILWYYNFRCRAGLFSRAVLRTIARAKERFIFIFFFNMKFIIPFFKELGNN